MHSFISANCNSIGLGLDDFCVCLLQTLFCKKRERERERRRRVKLRFFLGNKIRVLFNFKTVVQSDLSGFVCNRTGTNFEVFWLHDLLTSQFFFFFLFSSLFLVCIIFLQVSFFLSASSLFHLFCMIVTFFRVRIATVLSVVKTVQEKKFESPMVVYLCEWK